MGWDRLRRAEVGWSDLERLAVGWNLEGPTVGRQDSGAKDETVVRSGG